MDTTTPPTLTGDDAMAFNFLSRAANAIVSASDLSRQLTAVQSDLAHISEARDTLDEIKRTQEDRIATLEAQLATSLEAEARATQTVADLHAVVADRQNSINILDGTVAYLQSQLDATRTERDDYGLKHMEACDALAASQTKLGAIVDAMTKVGFNVSTIVPAEPETDYRDYAADNPDYRATPEPIYPTPKPDWDRPHQRVQPEERTPEPFPEL